MIECEFFFFYCLISFFFNFKYLRKVMNYDDVELGNYLIFLLGLSTI